MLNRRRLLTMVAVAPVAAVAAKVGIAATPASAAESQLGYDAAMSKYGAALFDREVAVHRNTVLYRTGLISRVTAAESFGIRDIAELERDIEWIDFDGALERFMHGVHPHDERGECVLIPLGTLREDT